ncbi:32263_t:CDS:2, partial [Racocetra persica]
YQWCQSDTSQGYYLEIAEAKNVAQTPDFQFCKDLAVLHNNNQRESKQEFTEGRAKEEE